MKKIKGETLIEGLLSMFFIVNILMPVSNLLIKTYKLNTKVDEVNKTINENRNLLEFLQTVNYEIIEKLVGIHKIKDITEFYGKFFINNKYRELKFEKYDVEKKILIEKTDNYYSDGLGNKQYIFKISVDNISDFYFPKLD